MLNAVIRFALRNRLLVLAVAAFTMLYGGWLATRLPIDVFPDLNRPRVVVMTESPGMAPEEVETLITFPLETVLNGASGVQAVRTSSDVGLSLINVEFEWGADIFKCRQVVTERLALASDQLPPGAKPHLAPIASLMGQIQIVGLRSASGDTSPERLRTLADWVVRQRLLTIPGVAQVIVMGGDRKQYQVLVNPHDLLRFEVSLSQVKQALRESNQNVAGGYLEKQGPSELLVRSLGRVNTLDELRRVVVARHDDQSIRLEQVARVREGPQVKRGDCAAFVRDNNGQYAGGPAVALTILKQPGADTRAVTDRVRAALRDMRTALPADVRIDPALYQQREFIDLAIENVLEALRDGGLLVIIILFLFLFDPRTTFITLTAIPLSLVITCLVFAALGQSVNTMTLGGLAIAIGELVDDAIVDVENVHRRLRENAALPQPRPTLLVVYDASREIRNAIVYGTLLVMLVFVPLFALSGMEGRLFKPLGLAYVTALAASLLVSLTVTPVLCHLLLGRDVEDVSTRESLLTRILKAAAGWVIGLSTRFAWPVLGAAALGVAGAALLTSRLENDFLPPFNEGALQINVMLPPGASLATTKEVSDHVSRRLQQLPDITTFVSKTGRAELDEHVMGVNVTEIIAAVDPHSPRSRAEVIDEVSAALADVPGVVTAVEQPLSHLISHMLSGVKGQIAVKLFGDDLDELRRQAERMRALIDGTPGVRDLQVEQQTLIPQLRVEAEPLKLERLGLRQFDVNDLVQTAMQGETVSQVLQGQRAFDLVVRLDDRFREDLDALRRLTLELPDGGSTKLEDVARIYPAGGPNTIQRENVRRRIIVQCNVRGRGLVDVVGDIKQRLRPVVERLPTGYYVEYGGQFESQQSASASILVLFGLSLVGMFLLLENMFGSAVLAAQVMMALPMAFIGAVAALWLTDQTLTVAAMVGFVSLCGIASRNGILLLDHYLHLARHEGETLSKQMITRAGQERMAPVLMTALTSGIGLTPLALAAGEPGKEILYPVATVIIGGLISSTLLEFCVRPALFWTLGRGAAQRLLDLDREQAMLNEAPDSNN